MSAPDLTLWLYRCLDTDDDGDPLDFGVVAATDSDAARVAVTAHLTELGIGDTEVRLYPIQSVANGVFPEACEYTAFAFEQIEAGIHG